MFDQHTSKLLIQQTGDKNLDKSNCTYLCADRYFANSEPGHTANNSLLWHHGDGYKTLQHPGTKAMSYTNKFTETSQLKEAHLNTDSNTCTIISFAQVYLYFWEDQIVCHNFRFWLTINLICCKVNVLPMRRLMANSSIIEMASGESPFL